MANETLKKSCNCPMECDSLSYTFSLVSNPFDPEEMCPSKTPEIKVMMREFYLHKFPPQMIRNLKMYKNNVTSDQSDICKRNIQYRAEVTFQLATNEMPVTVISRRLSFFDKLSGFGKK